METIGRQSLWSFYRSGTLKERSNFEIRKGDALHVANFLDLATKVAELQFKNPDYVLLFRGQAKDYMRSNENGSEFTSLQPTLLRGQNERGPTSPQLRSRFSRLNEAENTLVDVYREKRFAEVRRLERQQILRWSILQHYKICDTPLLDVTHSLRIAASFASIENDEDAYIFALGVPNLSGAVTASAEAGIQIIRLSSVCPPSAMRPHIQEGYLLGEYPDLARYDQKQYYTHYEVDFGRRLIAKFHFSPKTFWRRSGAFPRVDHNALYPNANDPLFELANLVKNRLPMDEIEI